MIRRLFTAVLVCILFLVGNAASAADAVLDGDKTLVLMIFDDHCKVYCKEVRPILQTLKEEYGDRVAFHEIDFSEKTKKAAFESAKQLGVQGSIAAMLDFIPIVGVYTAKRKIVKEISGAKTKETYVKYIESALKQSN